ncbi:MAG: maleylpyruvate isomerase N-terminal domain-containing protein [Chloroflexi bacterium]|nr:maleylpyruvate isomerase N-terminal domain-containing protein [Chloroflexota bacterium]
MDDAARNLDSARQIGWQILAEVQGLSDEEWERPACGQWSVRETLAHLARSNSTYAEYFDNALQGSLDPRAGAGFMSPDLSEATRNIAERTRAFAATLDAPPVDLFKQTHERLLETLERFDEADWERPTFHSSGIMPARGLLEWRLAENALHRWDMLAGLGRPAAISEHALSGLLSWLARWLKVGFRVDASAGRHSLFSFSFEPPTPNTGLSILVADGSLGFARSGLLAPGEQHAHGVAEHVRGHEVDGDRIVAAYDWLVGGPTGSTTRLCAALAPAVYELVTDAETAILALAGRCSFEAAVADGRLVWQRSPEGAGELRRLFHSL